MIEDPGWYSHPVGTVSETIYPNKKQTGAPIVYICPMHPEVKSDGPGKCPKCGMDLQEEAI
jgi:hypothetical protein